MSQSTYTTISKSVGFEGEPIDLPTKERAEELYNTVARDQSEKAFEEVLRIYRFGKRPESYAQEEIVSLIDDAYHAGYKIFR